MIYKVYNIHTTQEPLINTKILQGTLQRILQRILLRDNHLLKTAHILYIQFLLITNQLIILLVAKK